MPVVSCEDEVRRPGIVTRSDLLGMYGKPARVHHYNRTIRLGTAPDGTRTVKQTAGTCPGQISDGLL